MSNPAASLRHGPELGTTAAVPEPEKTLSWAVLLEHSNADALFKWMGFCFHPGNFHCGCVTLPTVTGPSLLLISNNLFTIATTFFTLALSVSNTLFLSKQIFFYYSLFRCLNFQCKPALKQSEYPCHSPLGFLKILPANY